MFGFPKISRWKLNELKPGEPLWTIIDQEERLENNVIDVTLEMWYQIRNNRNGRKIWVNYRFINNYIEK